MAEVEDDKRFLMMRRFLYLFILLIILPVAIAQTVQNKKAGRKKIELIYADSDVIIKDQSGVEVHHIIGNVKFRHNEITMDCDSAHYIPSIEQVRAFSRIHIEQGDTLDLYGGYLFYDGKTELAKVNDNVELVDKETHLYTSAIDYDVRNKVATYTTGGRITNADNALTSQVGVYYVSNKLFHFKENVRIVNPDYVITGDTMDYNTQTEISYFTGPTELKGDSLYMYCEKGWYDTKNDITSVWKNSVIDNRKQIVNGDSLFYNKNTGFGEAWNNVVIQDTSNNIAIEGNYSWYYRQPEKFLVTDKAVFIQISDQDSLFLHADTINAITVADTSATGYRLLRAFHGCRIFSGKLQAHCDSISYSFQDSVIRFYYEPILWSEENQLTADSMAVFTKNREADRLELFSSAFVTSQVDSIRFNQIKGRSLTGYFKDNELSKINVNGNGESIYYLLDGDEIAGVNHSKCARIEAVVEDGKVKEITDFGTPDGVIDPPDINKPEELKLEGFTWYDMLRPKQKSDIFRK